MGPGADGKDDSPVPKRGDEPETPGNGNLAPEGQSQNDLSLRSLQDVLKDTAKTKELEDATGLSREQIEQFVKKYQKPKAGPAGPGREIDLKSNPNSDVARPSSNLPGLDSSTPFSTRSRRASSNVATDEIRDNVESVRLEPPPEMRGKWQGYKSRLEKVRAPKRPAPASTKGKGK
jgi:hypothetical protein